MLAGLVANEPLIQVKASVELMAFHSREALTENTDLKLLSKLILQSPLVTPRVI